MHAPLSAGAPVGVRRGASALRQVERHDIRLLLRALVFLRGEIQHKNLWLVDLETGAERQLTNFPPAFEIRDFDVSPNGREAVVERVQEQSDIVSLDLAKR